MRIDLASSFFGFFFILCLLSCGEHEVELQVGDRLKDTLDSTPKHREQINRIDQRLGSQEREIEEEKESEAKLALKRAQLRDSALQVSTRETALTPLSFQNPRSEDQIHSLFSGTHIRMSGLRELTNNLRIPEIQKITENEIEFAETPIEERPEQIIFLSAGSFHLSEDERIETNGRDLVIIAHRTHIEGRIRTRPLSKKSLQNRSGKIQIFTYALELGANAELNDQGPSISSTEVKDCLAKLLKESWDPYLTEAIDEYYYEVESLIAYSTFDKPRLSLPDLSYLRYYNAHLLAVRSFLLKQEDLQPRVILPSQALTPWFKKSELRGGLEIYTGLSVPSETLRHIEKMKESSNEAPYVLSSLTAEDYRALLPSKGFPLIQRIELLHPESGINNLNQVSRQRLLAARRDFVYEGPVLYTEYYRAPDLHPYGLGPDYKKGRIEIPTHLDPVVETSSQLAPLELNCDSSDSRIKGSQPFIFRESEAARLLNSVQKLPIEAQFLPESFHFHAERMGSEN
jgi:hypothetical protein